MLNFFFWKLLFTKDKISSVKENILNLQEHSICQHEKFLTWWVLLYRLSN